MMSNLQQPQDNPEVRHNFDYILLVPSKHDYSAILNKDTET